MAQRTMKQILLIEDHPDVTRVTGAYLEREGYRVSIERDGAAGLLRAQREHPDLIILECMLPKLAGIDVLRELRRGSETPVLFLTARSEEADRILGLELGADDFLTKPFSPRELVARVGAILRRSQRRNHQPQVLRHGSLELQPDARSLQVGRELVHLSELEFDLLHTLMTVPGRVFSRHEFIERVWHGAHQGSDRLVDVHISKLRQKLKYALADDPIRTVRGIGYALR